MKQYVVDAFTDEVFKGNPAAICILDSWLDEDTMMNITTENNLSETAFAVKEGDKYRLRWFTPGGEIDLCGHATLACAYILFNYYEDDLEYINFDTMSGSLGVKKIDNMYELVFPAYKLKKVIVTEEIVEAMGARPIEAYIGRDLLCVFENEEDIINMNPDQTKVEKLDGLLLNVTAKKQGDDADTISRTFAPKCNVVEDPVCGSGHCHIVPYWAEKLGKKDIVAYQASKRGGYLYCNLDGNIVYMRGKAALYSESEIYID